MKGKAKRFLAGALTGVLVLGVTAVSAPAPEVGAAAKNPKLTKKVSVKVKKTKKLKITNTKKIKKTKWSVKSKKIVKLSKKKKTSVVIKGVKKGKTTVTAKVTLKNKKKKTLKVTVTVKAATPTPSVAPTASPTVKPTAKATATPKPTPDNRENPPARDTSDYEQADIVSNTFDENWEPFVTRRNENQNVTFTLTDDAKFKGKALKVSGRERPWNGAFLELLDTGTGTDIVVANATYHVEFWVKQELNSKGLPDIFYCTTETAAVPGAEATDEDKTWIYLIDAGTKVDRDGTWVKVEGNFSVPASSKHFGLCFETKSFMNNFFIDEFHMDLVSAPAPEIELTGLQELYKDKFIVGNAVNTTTLQDPKSVEYLKKMYGSITMGNEMKPDAIMSNTLLNKNSDTAKDYVIPTGYTEDKVPTLNFTDTDFALKTAADNGLKLRVHTLLWHQQTPSWFFKADYSDDGALVTKEVMEKRLEFYVKSVMKHILSSEYADVVYAVDVANEYFHSNNAENAEKYKTYWQKIYGISSTATNSDIMTNTKPPYVKAAFVYAYDVLKEYSKTDAVKLYYNDYNTYQDDCAEKIIEMVNWINTAGDGNTDGTKLCAGVGMQSHLDTAYPTFDSYKAAFDKFVAAGFDIQVTELDITMGQSSTAASKLSAEAKARLLAQQTEYYGKLMQLYIDNAESVSAVVFWGMSSQGSWRAWGDPCIFGLKGMYDVKDSYKKIVELGGGTFPPAGAN